MTTEDFTREGISNHCVKNHIYINIFLKALVFNNFDYLPSIIIE